MTLANLLAWSLQVLLIAVAGALIPAVVRMHSSRAKLWYWHAMLIACLALPLVEPWVRPEPIRSQVTYTTGAFRALTTQSSNSFLPSWPAVIAGILTLGILLRLLWLSAGLVRLQRLYRSSLPIDRADDPFGEMRRTIAPQTEILVSCNVTSPVTFGLWNAVVLLPDRFRDLTLDERRSIICHELIHVERRDWAVMIGEEMVRSLLWFHPAIWWILGQVQLTREQVVDEAVIERTGDRHRYLDALLAIASLRLRADLAPAPLFLKKRHLRQRVESIVSGATMTKRNVLFPLAAALASLPVMIGIAAWQFPLRAAPQEAVDDSGIELQLNGARVLHRAGIPFPDGARARHLSGTVVATVTVDDKGEVTGVQAVSGPDELRKPVVQSLASWHFVLDSPGARTFDVSVRFDGGAAAPPTHAMDSNVVPESAEDAPRTIDGINVATLPAALRAKVNEAGILRVGDVLTKEKLQSLEASLRAIDDHLRITGALHGEGKIAVMVRLTAPPAAAIRTVKPIVTEAPKGIRVGGNIQSANLIKQVRPMYPAEAKMARIQGTVKFDVIIGADGFVKNIQLVSGHPLLAAAAMEAVKGWVYKPTLLNGNPVDVITVVDVNFTLAP